MLLALQYEIVNPVNNYTTVLSSTLVMPFKFEYPGSNHPTVLLIGAKTGLAIEGGSPDSEDENMCSAIGHFALQSATLLGDTILSILWLRKPSFPV